MQLLETKSKWPMIKNYTQVIIKVIHFSNSVSLKRQKFPLKMFFIAMLSFPIPRTFARYKSPSFSTRSHCSKLLKDFLTLRFSSIVKHIFHNRVHYITTLPKLLYFVILLFIIINSNFQCFLCPSKRNGGSILDFSLSITNSPLS